MEKTEINEKPKIMETPEIVDHPTVNEEAPNKGKEVIKKSVTEGGDWHLCNVGECPYFTKNRNAMRVHLRTKHTVYYCEKCYKRWSNDQKQMWKRHMELHKRNKI